MACLRSPVGEVPNNRAPDVMYVQYLLADWLLSKGRKPLVVDGICGPLTRAAIREFQKAQTRVVDGRLDVDGPTIRWLEHLHVRHTTSSVTSAEHLIIRSQSRPPFPILDPGIAAERYLASLRERFG